MTYEEYQEEQRKKAAEKRRRKLKSAGGFLKYLSSPQKAEFEGKQAEARLTEEEGQLQPPITAENVGAFVAQKEGEEETPEEARKTRDEKLAEQFRLEDFQEKLIAETAEKRGISLDEAELQLAKEDIASAQASGGTSLSAARRIQVQQQGEALAGTIGQISQLPLEEQSLKLGEASRVALIDALPRAIQFAAGGAVFAGGATLNPVGAALGAVGGFVAGFVSSIVSDFKDQRRDMNEQPQKALEDGKSNLNDIIGMMRDAPSFKDKQTLAKEFNNQLAIINQAYRQVKWDTSKDVLMFERSENLLADFEVFYSPLNGERNNLVNEMRMVLGAPVDPTNIYTIMEMIERRGLS